MILEKIFFNENLGEAAYILGIKIYRDRSRRLIGLSPLQKKDTSVTFWALRSIEIDQDA